MYDITPVIWSNYWPLNCPVTTFTLQSVCILYIFYISIAYWVIINEEMLFLYNFWKFLFNYFWYMQVKRFIIIIIFQLSCVYQCISLTRLTDPSSLSFGLAKISPNLFSMLISACATAVKIQISPPWTKHVAPNCEWFLSADNTSNGLGGRGAFSSPAGSLFIFKNFQKKKQHF